jgi:MoaA/NifB/PqqE/SkfB family radical SAM enzyme
LGGNVEENRATPERLGEICRKLKPIVAQASGGEPLLRRDLEQIVQAIRIPRRPPYVTLTTNGALLTKKRYESLCQAGVDEFSLSLDYPDERHDDFRGIPGLFSRISSLIHEINAIKNKRITLCCVIQSDNFKSLLDIAELASEWGVKINFSTYTFLRTGEMAYMVSGDELEELKEIINRIIEYKKKYGNIRNSNYTLIKITEFFEKRYIPNCRAGEKFFNVNPDGTLSPCGLIITDYKSRKELYSKFSLSNTCHYCYTSIRANCELPARQLLKTWGRPPRYHP